MRYHFVTFCAEDYDPTATYVLEYLKRELKSRRKEENSEELIETFIQNYVSSLYDFFKSLNELISRTETDIRYYKIFSVLGLSATLYPVIIILNRYNILDRTLQDESVRQYDFLDLIEIIDVRVYKVRGTDPKADIAKFAYQISNEEWKSLDMEKWMRWFNGRWMNENEFRSNLYGAVYRRSRAVLPHILLDYSEHISGKKLNLETLKDFIKTKALTIEHILSQKPKFTLKTHGFKSNDEYLDYEHTLGNLTLLEKSLNSSVNNKNVYDKVPFYDRSRFKITKALATKITHNGQFKKSDIETRTEQLIEYLENKWWC